MSTNADVDEAFSGLPDELVRSLSIGGLWITGADVGHRHRSERENTDLYVHLLETAG